MFKVSNKDTKATPMTLSGGRDSEFRVQSHQTLLEYSSSRVHLIVTLCQQLD